MWPDDQFITKANISVYSLGSISHYSIIDIHTRMPPRTQTLLILITLAVLTRAYDSLTKQQQIIAYYEDNSQFPVLHVYHDRHFSKSKQFQDFLQVLQDVEYRNRDYARFLLTDCESVPQGDSYSCDEMRRNKDSRMIVGHYPSTQFITYGGKRMQNPPLSKRYTHFSDVYTVDEIQGFLRGLMPNFYQQLDNLEQYDEWLNPLYSPNLLFASRQEELPEVLVRLGVHYFLRFDLGVVSDLADRVIAELNITSFPVLMVVRFNFTSKQHEIFEYPHTDFSPSRYEHIKSFLEPLALKQPRNDLLFHKMKIPTQHQIATTDSQAQLTQMLDRANGWALISLHNGKPQRLQILREKYGRFFEYYHLMDGQHETETLQMFDPEQKRNFDIPTNEIAFRALGKEDFLTNTSAWLGKNFVVVGVREKYGHFCTMSLNVFFRGLIRCLIVSEADYESITGALNMQFEYGFASAERMVNGSRKITGQIFQSGDFEEVYLATEYTTRKKSQEIIDAFFQQPITPVGGTAKLIDICAFPTKKCALLFTNPKKRDRTAFDYLSDVAKNFINEYQFYEIDLSCNPQFAEQIQSLSKQSGGLVVYHPQKESYVYLKAKLSKSTFERFLKANLSDHKKLPLHKFLNPQIEVHVCRSKPEVPDVDSL